MTNRNRDFRRAFIEGRQPADNDRTADIMAFGLFAIVIAAILEWAGASPWLTGAILGAALVGIVIEIVRGQ